jgi:hypothetical protein
MPAEESNTLGSILRREAPALLAAAFLAAGVQLGTLAAMHAWAPGSRDAVMASLLAALGWIVLSGPLLSAGAASGLRGLLRAGISADAAGVVLLGLWLWGSLSFVEAVKIYCVLAAVAIACAAGGRLGRQVGARHAWAVVWTVLLAALVTTPFWVGAVMMGVEGDARAATVGLAAQVSPVYALSAAMAQSHPFVWHQTAVMYEVALFHDYGSPPPVTWYACAVLHLGLAAAAGGASLLFRRTGRG